MATSERLGKFEFRRFMAVNDIRTREPVGFDQALEFLPDAG